MSLQSAMHIGRSALNAASAGIQVASNNISNASSPGYSRQIAHLLPVRGSNSYGTGTIGNGVSVGSIERQVDQALLARFWSGLNNEAGALQESAIMNQVEGSLNELTGFDLSSGLSGFFNLWSERANLSESSAVVVQEGTQLADLFGRLRGDLSSTRRQVDEQLFAAVGRANQLLAQIAESNRQIGNAEGGQGKANTMRDQRDELVSELAALVDVSIVEQSNGLYDVLVGSTPVVLGASARPLEVRLSSQGNEVQADIAIANGGSFIEVESGIIGGLLASRRNGVDRAISQLDEIAAQLIFQVNRIHSTSTNAGGLRSAMGSLTLSTTDRARAFNDPTNAALGALPFGPRNGGFMVHMTNSTTGEVTSRRIDVDLDGLTNNGLPGTGDDTTPEDIRAALAGIPGLNASFTADGRLSITADSNLSFSFSDDSSDVLATLGVNGFFQGSSANDMSVRSELVANPSRLGTGRIVDGVFVENGSALRISDLQSTTIDALGGQGFSSAWRGIVGDLAGRTEAAANKAAGATIVRENLEAQRSAISGVNLDEESINLLTFQRLYQGAARVIQTADELLDTLLSIV